MAKQANSWTGLVFQDMDTDPVAPGDWLTVNNLNGLPVSIVNYGPPTGWRYATPAGSATTVITRQPGVLHAIVINTTAAASITVYDNIAGSGNKIATLKASIAEGTYVYDVALNVGLTLVLAGASDVTVLYA